MFNKLFLTLSTGVSYEICHSEPCVRNLKQIRLRYLTFVRYDIAFNLAIMKQQLYFYNYHSFHCSSYEICHSEPCVRNLKQIRLRYLTFVRYDIAFNLAIMKQQLYFYNYHSFHCSSSYV